MAKEKLEPMSREFYDKMKAALEAKGYKVKNHWTPRTVAIHLEDIVLSETPRKEHPNG